ncbi:MAG: hypothetical protein Ct9H300mP11_07220 [Chloroflexota bacterium]|nr:MAG: hypothetical protein Ct9H300mP11_07220 [Chloroflexota bacterium]
MSPKFWSRCQAGNGHYGYVYGFILVYDALFGPHNMDDPADSKLLGRWMTVDQYTGGAEHAVMHLLYSRFFTKGMHDMGLVDYDEPFLRLFNQGVILGADHEKMSKSRGNVVNPDEVVGMLGADAVRCFLMFIGPWDQGGPWSDVGIKGRPVGLTESGT